MPSNSTNIIRAGQQDIDLVVDMRILFANDFAGRQAPEIEAQHRLNLKQYLIEELNSTYLSYYAEEEGKAVSIAGLVLRKQPGNLTNPSGRWGYIMNVYTLPEYRRKGLSALVMNVLMEAAAAEWGIGAFELHATEQGEPGYQKLGFVLHPEPTYRKFVAQ